MPEWIEVALRTLVAVISLFLMTKLLGKRQISQLSFFEYITGITVGNIAAFISLDINANWYLGLVAMLVWVMVSLGIELLQLKSKRARNFIDSKAAVLIRDGKIQEDVLKKERLTSDELLEQLRKRSVFRTADVEFAIMESNGEINVLLKKEFQPITPSHLGVKVAPEKAPQAVIMDGKMMKEALAIAGLNPGWLKTELEKLGVTMENVYLGQVDSYGQLYVDLYDDLLNVPEPQEKAALLAALKKCEADIEMFSLSTNDTKAKQMYARSSEALTRIIANVKPYLH